MVAGAEARFPAAGPMIGLGLGLITILYFTVSPLALIALGWNYDDSGGNLLEKVHPATTLTFIVFLYATLYVKNPLSNVMVASGRWPGSFVLLAAIALLIVHSIRVVQLPFTAFIDTFVAPIAVFFLFKDFDGMRGHRLALLLHGLIALNALIGIGEFASGVRLTPLVAGGFTIEDDWRSSALLGHPLANASVTGAYLSALALGGGHDLPRLLRVAAFIIAAAGMVVFGGRASTVILGLMLGIIVLAKVIALARGRRFRTRSLMIGLFAVPIVALVLAGLFEAGFFDQFLERFVDDRGSAETRVEMFELFRYLSLDELLFAPDAVQVATVKRIHNLDFGIESFWVSFVLSYGLIPGLVFFTALYAFCRDVVRALGGAAAAVLIFFFIVASTSVSLSVKTPVFAAIILLVCLLLRPQTSRSDSPVKDLAMIGRRAAMPVQHGRIY